MEHLAFNLTKFDGASETLDTFSPIPVDVFLKILPVGRLGSSFS